MASQFAQQEALVKQIAYAQGHEEFGLRDDEFVVRLWKGRGWNVQRGKSITRVYLGTTELVENLEARLRGALAAVAKIKRTKMTDVVIFEGLKVPPKDVPSAYRELYGLPPLFDRTELDVKVDIRVTLKHRETGVVVTKFTELRNLDKAIYAGREEITERVIEVIKSLGMKVKT